jgi:hypothetical protein
MAIDVSEHAQLDAITQFLIDGYKSTRTILTIIKIPKQELIILVVPSVE